MAEKPDLALARRKWRECAQAWTELALECLAHGDECRELSGEAATSQLAEAQRAIAAYARNRLLRERQERVYLDALDRARVKHGG
jgi:hypothetical protein